MVTTYDPAARRARYLANKERERERNKAWKAANPDKVREQKRRYYERHPDKVWNRRPEKPEPKEPTREDRGLPNW